MIPRKHLDERLGSSFVAQLLDKPHVTIGGVPYSKNDLVIKAKTGNFAAAKRLERALDEIGADTLGKVDPVALAQVRGVGETTIYVLLCLEDMVRARELELEDTTWRTFKHNHTPNGKNGKKGRKKR